tara:strand:- start:174 stop:818 length:645 start_codon:yes stop_codon:yes gene_type:complete
MNEKELYNLRLGDVEKLDAQEVNPELNLLLKLREILNELNIDESSFIEAIQKLGNSELNLLLKLREILNVLNIDESSFIKAIQKLTIPVLTRIKNSKYIMSDQLREEISNISKEKPELETKSKLRLLSELKNMKDKPYFDSIKIKNFISKTSLNELKQLYVVEEEEEGGLIKLNSELVDILEKTNLQDSFIRYLTDKLLPKPGGKKRRTKRKKN